MSPIRSTQAAVNSIGCCSQALVGDFHPGRNQLLEQPLQVVMVLYEERYVIQ